MVGVPAKLVTIITVYQAQTTVQAHLRSLGITGYSEHSVDGHGATGERHAGLIDAANIQFTVVTSVDHASKLLAWVERHLAVHHPSIAYASDVVAVPAARFTAT